MRERPNRTVSKTVVSTGTVGSNPTPSALLIGAFRSNALVRASSRPLVLSVHRWPLVTAAVPHFGVRMGCEPEVWGADGVPEPRLLQRLHDRRYERALWAEGPCAVVRITADRSRRVPRASTSGTSGNPHRSSRLLARCERRDRFNWPVVLCARRGGSGRPSDTYGVIRSSGPRAFAISPRESISSLR